MNKRRIQIVYLLVTILEFSLSYWEWIFQRFLWSILFMLFGAFAIFIVLEKEEQVVKETEQT